MGFWRNFANGFRKAVDPMAMLASILKNKVACVSFAYGDTCYAPGCGSGFKKAHACSETTNTTTNADKFQQFMESALGDEFQVISLEMANDWVNGSIYFPLWNWYKTKKKKYLFGLITKRAKNDYCSASKTYNTLKMRELCVESKLNDKVDSYIQNGVVYNTTNADGLDLYYYSMGSINEGKYHRLYATDIILLGSFNECDTDGVPPLYKYLPDTSANIPPFLSTKEMSTNESENSQSEYTPDDNGEISTTGMFWSNSKDPTDGLLFGLDCFDYTTKPKTCVNLDRVCELGVTLDGRYFDSHYRHDVFPDGMIKKDELQDMDIRAMFATLNANGLTEKYIDPNTLYEKYKFQYLYSTNFDGKLKDTKDADYIKFRYGNVLKDRTPNRFFMKNNSFYFYFGLKPGNTALDKFKRLYDAECEEEKIGNFSLSVSGIGQPICTNSLGNVMFTVNGAKLPYAYEITDKDGKVVSSDTNVMVDTVIIENQFENDIYTVKVQDSNDEVVYESVVVTIPYDDPYVLFDKKELTYYYIDGVPFSADDYGKLTISGCNINGENESFTSVTTNDNQIFSCSTSTNSFIVKFEDENGETATNLNVSVVNNQIVVSNVTPCEFYASLQYYCEYSHEYLNGQKTMFSFSNGKIEEVFLNDVPLSFLESSSFTSSVSAVSGTDMYVSNVWSDGIEDPTNYAFPTTDELWGAYLYEGCTKLDKIQYKLACIANLCQASYYTDNGYNTFILSAPNRKEFKKEVLFPNYGSTDVALENSNNNNYLLIKDSSIKTWSYLNGVTEVTCSADYPNIIHTNKVFSNAIYNLKLQDTHKPFCYLQQVYNKFVNNDTSVSTQTSSVETKLNRNGLTTALMTSFNPLICYNSDNISHNYFRVTDSKKNKKYPSNSRKFNGVDEETTTFNAADVKNINSCNWLRADFNDKVLFCNGQVGYNGSQLCINLNLEGGIPLAYDGNKNIIGDNCEYSIINDDIVKNDTSNGMKKFYEMYFVVNGKKTDYNDYVVKTISGGTFTTNIKHTFNVSSITDANLYVTDCSYDLNIIQEDTTVKAYTTAGRQYVINLLNPIKYNLEQHIISAKSTSNEVSAWTMDVTKVTPDGQTYMTIPKKRNNISVDWVKDLRTPIHNYTTDRFIDYSGGTITNSGNTNAFMYLASGSPIEFVKQSYGTNASEIIFESSDNNAIANMNNPMYFKNSGGTENYYAFAYQNFDENSCIDFIDVKSLSSNTKMFHFKLMDNGGNQTISSDTSNVETVIDVEIKTSNDEVLSFVSKDFSISDFSTEKLYSITTSVNNEEQTYYIIS